jgi:hypothetical protein
VEFSFSLENTKLRKLDLFPSSGEGTYSVGSVRQIMSEVSSF